ncbi:HNH/endonuclease VII fold putative polymorphic toxin [Enterobacter asburiae]|uniref:HNH/endonuclease VII fold putative polymorphic toxin n=1 Tax=Enterobacter asburiae TaxID=61645 RepID=UPI003BF7BA6E
MSQQPVNVEMMPLTDRNGKSILGDDYLPLKTREYTFSASKGESIVVQDHSPGHVYGLQALLVIRGLILILDLEVTHGTVLFQGRRNIIFFKEEA